MRLRVENDVALDGGWRIAEVEVFADAACEVVSGFWYYYQPNYYAAVPDIAMPDISLLPPPPEEIYQACTWEKCGEFWEHLDDTCKRCAELCTDAWPCLLPPSANGSY